VKELAEILQLSKNTVRKIIYSGQMKATKVGWLGWRVKEEELEKYLENF